FAGEARDRDSQLRTGELQHRTLRSRLQTLEPARERAQPGVFERLAFGHKFGEALAHPFLLPRRTAVDLDRMRQFREPAHLGGMSSATGHPALETERGHRDLPSFILRTDEILLRHLDVVEKDFVEVAMAIH